MPDKPKRASEYKSEQVALVRATCLYVATKRAPGMAYRKEKSRGPDGGNPAPRRQGREPGAPGLNSCRETQGPARARLVEVVGVATVANASEAP